MEAASEFGNASTSWDIAQVALTGGSAFKGSPCNAQFLEYIIWHPRPEK
jgi:hypothetical protein